MPEEKLLCSDCVEESHIIDHIEKQGIQGTCSYCDNEQKTAYEISLGLVGSEMCIRDSLKDCDFERDGELVENVISDLVGWDQSSLSSDIRQVLERKHFDKDDGAMGIENKYEQSAQYSDSRKRSSGGFENWHRFEESIRSESRFFNKTADKMLGKIFSGVENASTAQGTPVLRPLLPNETSGQLYRARIVSGEEWESALSQPDLQLGPPPSRKARSGRMNASGLSVFYGSFSLDTALAEVRPPVGSRVVIAKFDVIKELFVLDLKSLEKCVVRDSYFSDSFEEKAMQAEVLRLLSKLCSKPVLPGDEEFEYLTTQALADYLANNPEIDGIVFPSVQVQGDEENVALFHKSSRVNALTHNFTMEYDFRLEDKVFHAFEERSDDDEASSPKDQRTPTLEIDIDSIQILDVQGVSYDSVSQTARFFSNESTS